MSTSEPPMRAADGSYSIRVASRLTGIPADTLRMWERRYGFPNPRRRATGVRSYSHTDVDRLLLISRALRTGYRPGEVVGKPPEDLERLLASASASARPDPSPQSPGVHASLEALQRFDASGLVDELRRSLAILGAKRFLVEVAEPLADRVQGLWTEGRMGVRHARLLHATLGAQIKLLLSTYEGATRALTFLLTTLPGESGDLMPEMTSLYLAVHNARPHLLSDMPPDQIVDASRELGADVVILALSSGSDVSAAALQIRWMLSVLPPGIELWVSGSGAERLDIRDTRFKVVQSWANLNEQLDRLRAAPDQ